MKDDNIHLHEECDHSHDGTNNEEHILDIISETEMLIENLHSNTDTAFEMLKIYDDVADQDMVDVVRIRCSEILDSEKLAGGKFEEFASLKEGILKSDRRDEEFYVTQAARLYKLYKEIESAEKVSTAALEMILKITKGE